jgi:hypothetical protein
VGAAQALGGLVAEQRDVGDEVATGQLQLDDGPVALPAAVAARADRAQVPAVGDLDQAQVVQQLAEEGDARHSGHVVLGRLDDDRGDPLPRPGHDRVRDLEERRGSLHLAGAPCPWNCVLW